MKRSEKVHYNKELRKKARKLRNNATKSEIRLWSKVLSSKQLMGYTFRRQRPVLHYIADFMCVPLKLIIELDGISHLSDKKYELDLKRQNELEKIGFTMVRFNDRKVFNNIDNVRRELEGWVRYCKKSC
jgi:very-short-patch-repair endonuclease